MKIAIDSFSFYKHFGKHWYIPSKPYDIKWYCRKCVELGADGLHIDPYHYDLSKDIKWIHDFAEKHDLYVELGASGTTKEELFPYIEAAKKLGCKVLRTFVGGSCLDGRDVTNLRTKTAVRNLEHVLPYAEDAGVILAVENHGDIFIDDMKILMDVKSDYLGICYDSGNFAFTGEDPVKAVDIFSDKIVCTHLKDVCTASSIPDAKPFETIDEPIHFCALGEGNLPMDKIIRLLQSTGIERITLEICTSAVNGIDEKVQLEMETGAIESSMQYIRSKLKF